MKRLMISLLGAVAFAAAAQNPEPAGSQPREAATAEAAQSEAKDKEPFDTLCLRHTGSRITPRPNRKGQRCISAHGRAYSREDIQQTGEVDIADALRRLDVSVR